MCHLLHDGGALESFGIDQSIDLHRCGYIVFLISQRRKRIIRKLYYNKKKNTKKFIFTYIYLLSITFFLCQCKLYICVYVYMYHHFVNEFITHTYFITHKSKYYYSLQKCLVCTRANTIYRCILFIMTNMYVYIKHLY